MSRRENWTHPSPVRLGIVRRVLQNNNRGSRHVALHPDVMKALGATLNDLIEFWRTTTGVEMRRYTPQNTYPRPLRIALPVRQSGQYGHRLTIPPEGLVCLEVVAGDSLEFWATDTGVEIRAYQPSVEDTV